MSEINSMDYWDGRFKEGWEANHGRCQSRLFAKLALGVLPDWLRKSVNEGATVLDWGCALGDGTEYLAQALPGAQVSGCDFSREAIEQATRTYPTVEFIAADFIQGERADSSWDFIFSSNTLEHFHEPWKIVDELAKRSRRGFILLLPFREINRIAEHHYTFLSDNVPVSYGDFCLLHSMIVDAGSLPSTEWVGEQILLVFVKYYDQLARRLMLRDIKIETELSFDKSSGDKALRELSDYVNRLGTESLATQVKFNEALTRVSELEGRVILEQRSAMSRIEERDQLAVENAALRAGIDSERDVVKGLRVELDEANASLAEVMQKLSVANERGVRLERIAKNSVVGKKKSDAAKAAGLAMNVAPTLRERTGNIDTLGLFNLVQQFSDVTNVLQERLARAESNLESVLKSKSWALTTPLRRLISGIKGGSHGIESEFVPVSEVIQPRLKELNLRLAERTQQARQQMERDQRGRRLFIFTGVPYDDIGGGQRAAQFARVLLGRGEVVTYVYAYPKWENGVPAESKLSVSGLTHLYVDSASTAGVLVDIQPDDVAIFELPHKAFLPYLERCMEVGTRTVFELIDAWNSSLGGDWFSEEIMQEYIDKSQVVVGTAKILQQSLISGGRHDALYLPNAANEAIFDSYRRYPRPVEYLENHRAILYFGSLYGEWFDWDSVNAAARRSPDARFYLIGDVPASVNVEANVLFLGARLIDELPKYLQHCDIAILPFKPGHISDAVSPIKIFEYIAMGAKVVANDLPEIREYPNVWIANDPTHFAELCSKSLPGQTNDVIDKFVMQNSWSARLDRVVPPLKMGRVVSVVVLMHNNAGIIRRCLDSLMMHGADYIKEIIVVDNNSADGGADLVENEYKDVRLIRNSRNGCSSGRNLGVASASGDYIAFFDSDQWITGRGAFEEALFLLDSSVELGAIGWAAGWFSSNNETFGGAIVDYLPARGTNTAEYRERGYRSDVGYLGSGGLFLRRDVFEEVGGFDEFYDPTCFEDTDFTISIKAAGYAIGYRDLQGIRHQAHQTTGASEQSESYKAIFSRNSEYFGKKWRDRSDLLIDVPL